MNASKVVMALMAAMVATSATAADWVPPAKRVAPTDGLVAQLKPKGETPRLPSGHPDLTGLWGGGPNDGPYVRFGSRALEFFEPDQVVMQRGNAWSRPIYKPELWEKVHGLDYGKIVDDPAFHCMNQGVPRMNMPAQIVLTEKGMVAFNQGYTAATRYIPIDGRTRDPADADYANINGVPLGHWEGDTLVIESVGFDDITWVSWTGYFHSDKMKVTERFRRQGDVLYYQFTVDDPEVLAQPWTSETFARRFNPNPLARLEEVPHCKEQDSDQIVDPLYRG